MIDIIGIMTEQGTSLGFNSEGIELFDVVTLQGYHVNTTEAIEGADEFIVTPSPARRVFAPPVTIEDTFFYRFNDLEHFRTFVPEDEEPLVEL